MKTGFKKVDECNNCPEIRIVNAKLESMDALQNVRDIEQEKTTSQIVLRLDTMENNYNKKFERLDIKIDDLRNDIPKIITRSITETLGKFAKWFLLIVVGGGFIIYMRPHVIAFFSNIFG